MTVTARKKKILDVSFYHDWCKSCGICMAFCTRNIIRPDENGKPELTDNTDCIGCRFCEMHCPDFAITVSERILYGRRSDAEGKRQRRLLQGDEAIVYGALAARCRFFAGYPITPASEISEQLSVRLPAVNGTFIQMEDEIAGIGAVIGASLAGVNAMTATSGPGFSLMQENLGFACAAEVPCVIVNVMRGRPAHQPGPG